MAPTHAIAALVSPKSYKRILRVSLVIVARRCTSRLRVQRLKRYWLLRLDEGARKDRGEPAVGWLYRLVDVQLNEARERSRARSTPGVVRTSMRHPRIEWIATPGLDGEKPVSPSEECGGPRGTYATATGRRLSCKELWVRIQCRKDRLPDVPSQRTKSQGCKSGSIAPRLGM